MGKQQKKWTVELKEQRVMALLRGENSAAGLSRKYGAAEPLIYKWRGQFVEARRKGLTDGCESKPEEMQLKLENQHLKELLAEKELELHVSKISP
ncbi:MAG: transposase [Trueperaceae bacterium]